MGPLILKFYTFRSNQTKKGTKWFDAFSWVNNSFVLLFYYCFVLFIVHKCAFGVKFVFVDKWSGDIIISYGPYSTTKVTKFREKKHLAKNAYCFSCLECYFGCCKCNFANIVVIWEFAGKKLIIKLSVAASWQSEVLPWLINKLWNSL